MSAHTPGPWIHATEQGQIGFVELFDGTVIAQAQQQLNDPLRITRQANAKRIVTCVNALDGLSQDALDGGWNFKDQGAYTVRVESQRDDLLKALTDLRDAIEAGKEPALADANRAIRKAGGAV